MDQLSAQLDTVAGMVSLWIGTPQGSPYATRHADDIHYAASMMKIPVLVALHRGDIPAETEIEVHNRFGSAAPGRPTFGCERRHDQDDEVWLRLGEAATLRWLAERMITRSSNLAANLVLERIGLDPVAEAWRQVGARHSVVHRGIGDQAAAEAGITNLVTAADLGRLLGAIAVDRSQHGPAMISTLSRQRRTEDLAAGLPPGTRVAHKNGWVMGVRHAAGVVYPQDAPPFVVAVCCTTPLAINRNDDEACQVVSSITRWAWTERHSIGQSV